MKYLIQAKHFLQTITPNPHNSPNDRGINIPFYRQKADAKTSYINCPKSQIIREKVRIRIQVSLTYPQAHTVTIASTHVKYSTIPGQKF